MVDFVLIGILGTFGLIAVVGVGYFVLTWMKGKIIIELDDYNYSPGDTIKGNVILKLKKSVESKGLTVGLMGVAKNKKVGGMSFGKKKKRSSGHSSSSTIFDFDKPIDKPKVYPAGETKIPFNMKIPKKLNNSTLGGAMGKLMKGVDALMGNFSSVSWYVTSNLDAKGVDLRKKIQVNIG